MKVITKCIIDLETLKTVAEISHEYSGPIAECKGGGSAGSVDYPAYMRDIHNDWLDAVGTDTIEVSMTSVMNTALGASPYAALVAYDPATPLTESDTAIAAFAAVLAGISDIFDWDLLFSQGASSVGTKPSISVEAIDIDDMNKPANLDVADLSIENIDEPEDLSVVDIAVPNIVAPADLIVADKAVADKVVGDAAVPDIADTPNLAGITDPTIVADVAAFAAEQDDNITTRVLPRFRRGMQDIGAVVSSAFPIGEAIIEAFQARDVAKYDSGLRVAAVMKNADIEAESERLHLDVKKSNLSKAVEISRTNLMKDVEIGKANQAKDVEIERANLSKDIEAGRTNTMKALDVVKSDQAKEVEIEKSNLMKDIEVGKTNSVKELDVLKTNLMKDIEIGRTNLTKAIEVGKTNLMKEIDVDKTNLMKAVDVAKANQTKDIQVADLTIRSDAEYKRMYLEAASQMLRLMLQRIAWQEGYARLVVEANRIKIVANKEETDMNMEIGKLDSLWDLEVFQYGGNLLGAVSGGAVGTQKPTLAASVLGGAMSGAAAGAQIGGPYGALAGSIFGVAAGLLS